MKVGDETNEVRVSKPKVELRSSLVSREQAAGFTEVRQSEFKQSSGVFEVGNRGWAKSPAPLLNVSVNISAQWLIGRFVRILHSKSDLINCAGVGRRTLL
ncbi:hypothetical protein HO979_10215 [Streptococcus suis]|nr:hypothetical protein [Streptococcus suis]NQO24560.1 hypothetical protein [Streptococcus suis]